MPDERVINKIYLIRKQKVELDRDLAELYGVSTRAFKQAVNRNMDRFPEDFMFEVTTDELQYWRLQISTSNTDKMGLRYPTFCFTEQHPAMATVR